MPIITFSLPNSKGEYSAKIESPVLPEDMVNEMKVLQDNLIEVSNKEKRTKKDKDKMKKLANEIEDLGMELKEFSENYFDEEIEKLRIAKAIEVRNQ